MDVPLPQSKVKSHIQTIVISTALLPDGCRVAPSRGERARGRRVRHRLRHAPQARRTREEPPSMHNYRRLQRPQCLQHREQPLREVRSGFRLQDRPILLRLQVSTHPSARCNLRQELLVHLGGLHNNHLWTEKDPIWNLVAKGYGRGGYGDWGLLTMIIDHPNRHFI